MESIKNEFMEEQEICKQEFIDYENFSNWLATLLPEILFFEFFYKISDTYRSKGLSRSFLIKKSGLEQIVFLLYHFFTTLLSAWDKICQKGS